MKIKGRHRSHLQCARASALDDRQVSLACLFTIGVWFLLSVCWWIENIDDLHIEHPGLVQQTQVGGIANRLWGDGRIKDQLALMDGFLLLRYTSSCSRGLVITVIRLSFAGGWTALYVRAPDSFLQPVHPRECIGSF